MSFKLFSCLALTRLVSICRPRIIYQAIHAAKRILRCLHQPQPISLARDVSLVEAHGFWGCGDGRATAFLVDVGDDDTGALRGEALGDGRAVAGATAFILFISGWGLGRERRCTPVTMATLPARRPAWGIADIGVVS